MRPKHNWIHQHPIYAIYLESDNGMQLVRRDDVLCNATDVVI